MESISEYSETELFTPHIGTSASLSSAGPQGEEITAETATVSPEGREGKILTRFGNWKEQL